MFDSDKTSLALRVFYRFVKKLWFNNFVLAAKMKCLNWCKFCTIYYINYYIRKIAHKWVLLFCRRQKIVKSKFFLKKITKYVRLIILAKLVGTPCTTDPTAHLSSPLNMGNFNNCKKSLRIRCKSSFGFGTTATNAHLDNHLFLATFWLDVTTCEFFLKTDAYQILEPVNRDYTCETWLSLFFWKGVILIKMTFDFW